MRRARITYPGAFHHAMNRGHAGTDIFYGNKNKSQFIDYLAEATTKLKIKIEVNRLGIGDWGLKIMIGNKETFA